MEHTYEQWVNMNIELLNSCVDGLKSLNVSERNKYTLTLTILHKMIEDEDTPTPVKKCCDSLISIMIAYRIKCSLLHKNITIADLIDDLKMSVKYNEEDTTKN